MDKIDISPALFALELQHLADAARRFGALQEKLRNEQKTVWTEKTGRLPP